MLRPLLLKGMLAALLMTALLATGCANVVVIADDSLTIERHGNTVIISCVCDDHCGEENAAE